MTVGHLFRTDMHNVGDWFCAPNRYFAFDNARQADILDFDGDALDDHVIVGGGGLLADTFHPHMRRLAELRPRLKSLVAWGVGESQNVDRRGGFVYPYAGVMPDYLARFDLVGVRDFGAEHRWVPCASCMHPDFDRRYEIEREVGIYQHRRIAVPIEGFDRITNEGSDLARALEFLGSSEIVITNSYHGAYWATLLGRRVLAIPNMSKMYRFKHSPVICRPEDWKRYVRSTVAYDDALTECRDANQSFYHDVLTLQASA